MPSKGVKHRRSKRKRALNLAHHRELAGKGVDWKKALEQTGKE